MFDNPPKCFLHRQASFLAQAGNFPKDVVANIDERAGVFPLPPIQAGSGQPVLGAGDLAGLFNKEDNTVKVLKYILSKEIGEALAPKGGFISPWKDFDQTKYPNETMRDIAKIAYSSSDAVFDGSDVMPGEVGSGSFWRGMVAWVTGQKDTDTVLSDIDKSWPKK
jgi:alpha-glucoside transport system substrate-binding protein